MSIILTAALMITALPLASCGSKEPEPEKSRVDHVYKATEIDLGEDVSFNRLMPSDTGVSVLCSETIDSEKGVVRYLICDIDGETGEFTSSPLPELSREHYLSNIARFSDGSFLALINSYDMENGKSIFSLEKVAGDSFEPLAEDLAELFDSTGEDSVFGGRNFYVQYLAIDREDNIVIATSSAICVFDRTLKKLFEIEISGYLRNISASADGRICVTYDDLQNGNTLCYIDFEKRGLGDPIALPDSDSIRNAKLYIGPGFDIYYSASGLLCGYSEGDAEPTVLVNWVNSDITPDSVRNLAIIDSTRMVCYTYEFMSEDPPCLLFLKQIPEEEIPEKYLINVAYEMNGDGAIESAAVKFNRMSDEYRVVLKDYSSYNTSDDYTASENQLQNEIIAGDGPDIVMLNSFSNKSELIAQGAFADLNEIINNDESFDRSKYFSSVLDAGTYSDGKMYQFIARFGLSTYAAKRSNLGFESWDAGKFIDFAAGLGDGEYLINNISRDGLINLALSCSMDSFVDYEKAECSFDSPVFRKLLEYAKSMPEEFKYSDTLSGDDLADYNADSNKPLRENKLMLAKRSIYALSDLISQKVNFIKSSDELDDVIFIGYPVSEGSGTIINSRTSFGITKTSLVKKGAWEFIKYFSERRSNRDSGDRRGLSSCIAVYEDECAYNYDRVYNFKFTGGWSSTNLSDSAIEDMKKRGDGVVYVLTEKDTAALRAIIESAGSIPDGSDKIFEIISEESAMYFSDAKSLDETVKVIQDRVSIYISEKS